MSELKKGLIHETEFTVTEEQTAKSLVSGSLRVLSTPIMIAMMERTAWESVRPYLGQGYDTVGTVVNIAHESATPVGMKVRCRSVLADVDGRKLTFAVTAFDEKGLIGKGTHCRFIINEERFQLKTDSKKA